MSASVGSRRAGSKAWGGWAAVVLLLSAACTQSTFTDKRDGQKYRTVNIGKQRWMAENLNFKTEKSRCYGEGGVVRVQDGEPLTPFTALSNAEIQVNCTKYGRLYNWDDAMKACPVGWRIPSDEDWDSLAVAVGGVFHGGGDWKYAGKKLKSKSGWKGNGNGTDEYGFSALPGGYGYSGGYFINAGNYGGYWWSATWDGATTAKYRYMFNYNDRVDRYYCKKTNLYSVRCVQQ